ncbi:fructose ABC transporter substrate-binding protein [Rhizobium leguminosarum bv. phaseoli CCGM1]|nr:fructose ABC transporter substrate-binding protein [Rhizobium leguminosarum bv. phaseoli CCGM1]
MTSRFLSLLIASVKGTGGFGSDEQPKRSVTSRKFRPARGGAGKLWEEFMKKSVLAFGALALGVAFSAPVMAADVSACLITKTDTNPFFVKMKEGATAKAKELGVSLKSYAGKVDGDSESQVAAIESCIADGAKGILLTASDTKGIVSSVKKARDAGVLVIALDTPLEPADAADATFATDNLLAGKLIGQWAKETLGDKAKDAKVGFLDLTPSQPTVDVLRDQGFMMGFGIDPKNPDKIGDEDDKRIVGHDVTNGNEEGGRKAMENLLQKDPGINVIHTINEPAAVGAYQALKAVGMEKNVLIVSVDGGCPGVKSVKEGVIGATSQQYPLLMASLGIEAIKKFADSGEKPKPTEGKSFFDTGVSLVTDKPVSGVKSIDTKEGTDKCWG